MTDATSTIRDAVEDLEDEYEYDADIGYVGDEDGGILTAYIPTSRVSEFRQLAEDNEAGFSLSHTVPELDEAVVSFEFGDAKQQ